ncbi:hypothetical protein O181_008036 [Austropuccinia psidii MF-1]|uniref:Thioredoxin domain-containing protein n=1 Tax=Austropuccinia psidii MF-1 TaxID=1389203 RepID=A0A9Q3BP27_9BASI|nr:hypothetical protein [Austropuccinia psidii MF-1]
MGYDHSAIKSCSLLAVVARRSPRTTTPMMSNQATLPTKSEDTAEEEQLPDDFLDKLDDDFELLGFREQRLDQLRREIAKNQQMREDHHGRYLEIKDEKELIKITANTNMAVVHFFHTDFERCKLMDQYLEQLASKFFSTRFLKVDVANVPWLVTKLSIKVLPCVIGFLDGVTKERIVGFEGITGESSKDINSAALELKLKQAGVIKNGKDLIQTLAQRSAVSFASQNSDHDEDWDD